MPNTTNPNFLQSSTPEGFQRDQSMDMKKEFYQVKIQTRVITRQLPHIHSKMFSNADNQQIRRKGLSINAIIT